MAILDLASHPFAYVTIAELSDYWRLSRVRVIEHVAAGRLEAIELGPGIYRVRTATALAFERENLVGNSPRGASVVPWPWPALTEAGAPAGEPAAVAPATPEQNDEDDCR
jgi:hypothetical protein